ncbi:MAG: hypothetical protein V1703_00925 [Candidatus Altiarchaeota archaeon]
MENKLFKFLKKQDRLLTMQELAFTLNMPYTSICDELRALRSSGKVREVTIDRFLAEGK